MIDVALRQRSGAVQASRPRRWRPRSMTGVVFALYAATVTLFVLTSAGVFCSHQYRHDVARTEAQAAAAGRWAAPFIAEHVDANNDERVKQILTRLLGDANLASIELVEPGDRVRLSVRTSTAIDAQRLLERVAQRSLQQMVVPLPLHNGRDVTLRITPRADLFASAFAPRLYRAAWVTGVAWVAGLLLLAIPLHRWSQDLRRLRRKVHGMTAADAASHGSSASTPAEIRWAFKMLDRTLDEHQRLEHKLTQELRSRETALTDLRASLQTLMPHAALARERDPHDASTLRMLAQRQSEHAERLHAVLNLTQDGFVTFDLDGCVTSVSRAFVELSGLGDFDVLGLTADEFGRQLASCCDPSERAPIDRVLASARVSGPVFRERIHVLRPQPRTVDLCALPGDGHTVSSVLHLRDVTHESKGDRVRNRFLSVAAHELRLPMSSIYGFVELLLTRQMSTERTNEVLQAVHRQSELMVELINELLDLSRLESREQHVLTLEPVDLCALVHDVVEHFRPPDDIRPCKVLCHGSAWARADRSTLSQALRNVLSNAYKYSLPQDEVVVSVCRALGPDSQPCCGITVSDRGMGMTADEVARVGERFYRTESAMAISGTGLGMSIVKEAMAALGGHVDIRSRPALGTDVTLWLPLTESDGARPVEIAQGASLTLH